MNNVNLEQGTVSGQGPEGGTIVVVGWESAGEDAHDLAGQVLAQWAERGHPVSTLPAERPMDRRDLPPIGARRFHQRA